MKCPNCNAEINEGSIICPVCNTQFAFTANDNFINLPDDDLVIKSNGVEEYVDPHANDNSPVIQEKGVLNLKSNPQPKKVIKKVVKVNTQQPVEEEAVEISPSVNIDMNDELVEEKPVDMETTVVNVGGFTNTIIDTTSAAPQEQAAPIQQTAPPEANPGIVAPVTYNTAGLQTISAVDVQNNTIGQVTVTEAKEEKPKKKMSETMMLAMVMGLIVILLCFIVYILLQNNKNKENQPITTTQMTTFKCEGDACITTTTTTTEATTTTTRQPNKGLKSTIDMPLPIGRVALSSIFDDSTNKEYAVDVTLDKIYSPSEAQTYMANYNNTTYEEGLSVGVLQYTLTATEIDDGIELNPITTVEFYPVSVSNKFSFNGRSFNIGFVGTSDQKLTNKNSVTVTGYYNYPSDQPIGVICIGSYDGQKGCFKAN